LSVATLDSTVIHGNRPRLRRETVHDVSVDRLKEALIAGYPNFDHIAQDTDLNALH
jgi:hypothetical protein